MPKDPCPILYLLFPAPAGGGVVIVVIARVGLLALFFSNKIIVPIL